MILDRKKTPSEKASVDKRLLALDDLMGDGRLKSKCEQLSIQRQIDDLKNGHKRGLVWDEDEAHKAVGLFGFMQHWKTTKWSGRPLTLEPWQEHCIVAPLFGWYNEATRSEGGVRRFKKAGVELARKNGKSTMAGGIAIQGLVGDAEPGAEVYAAATKHDQAAIVFKDAKNIIGSDLKKLVTIFKGSIVCDMVNGSFKPLSADYNSLDGLNSSRIIIDELHAHRNRELYDVLVTSMGSRSQPMLIWISTAGYDRQSIWWEEHTYCEHVLEQSSRGNHVDDAYLSYMPGIDEKDDWLDPKIWQKANPNYGISVSPGFLKDESKKAEFSPSYENTFRRLHLNQVTEQSVRWLPMHLWDQSRAKDSMGNPLSKMDFEQSLIARPCYGGLDLASTRDLCAWGQVFPMDNGKYRIQSKCYAPSEVSSERQKYDLQSYQTFADQGLIELTHGNSTDYSKIRHDMGVDAKKYVIRQIALDPYNMENFYQNLLLEGWSEEKLVYFKQSYDNYNEAMATFLELLIAGRIEHNGDEALRWMAGNLCTKTNYNEYLMPDKKNSQDKIDGMVSILMAFALAIKDLDDHVSIYETPGNLSL